MQLDVSNLEELGITNTGKTYRKPSSPNVN